MYNTPRNNYNTSGGSRFGGAGQRSFAKKGTWNRAGGAPRVPKELFDAVCSDCRKDCKVPFYPSEGRPVQCLDCFRLTAPDRDDRKPSFDRSERPAFAPRERSTGGSDIDARLKNIERKLDNILELLDTDEE